MNDSENRIFEVLKAYKIVNQLENGQLEASYGLATESSQASRAQLDGIFKRMNQGR